MSCTCKKKSCKKCQESCYDVDVQNCPTPCPNGVYSTDCIFFEIENPSQSLNSVGVKSTTSLTKVLQNINKYFGLTSAVNLSGINWYTFNPDEKDLSKIYNTTQHISDLFKLFEQVDISLQNQINTQLTTITALQNLISLINSPELSGIKTGINTTDNLKQILSKIITFLDNLPPTTVNNYYTEVEISEQQGNKTMLLPDGIYTPETSAEVILDEICNTEDLTNKFKEMVNKSGVKHRFYLSNSSGSSIEVAYISYNNSHMTVMVPSNGGVEILNVKRIITNPSSTLTITYKGND